MQKKMMYLALLGVVSLLLLLAYNNISLRAPAPDHIESSYQNAVKWLYENKVELHEKHNSMMWWMLLRAAQLKQDDRLLAYVREYQNKNYSRYDNSAWRYLVLGEQRYVDVDAVLGAGLPPYRVYCVYSYTCNDDLAAVDTVLAQNNTNYCWENQPLAPACLTHQMMGLQFQKRIQCGEIEALDEKVGVIAEKIQRQAFFDVRVVDVYLQRTLVLLQSGHGEKVRPRWIRRILSAQTQSGGWSGFHPLLPVGRSLSIGFTGNAIAIRPTVPDLHATAQGILIMALLSATAAD